MKKSKNDKFVLSLIMMLFMSTGFLAACSNAGFSSNDGVDTSCDTTGLCNYLALNTTLGFYAQTSNFVVPGYVNDGSVLSVQGGMASVLKNAMGVCDRAENTGGYASCSSWVNGAHDFVLYSDTSAANGQLSMIIRSTPTNAIGSWYSYSVPDFEDTLLNFLGFGGVGYSTAAIYDPLVLNAQIYPINNSAGFEVRAYGPYGSYAYNKLFQLQVPNGQLNSTDWAFDILFDGQTALTGHAVRCQSVTCGLDSSYFNGSY